MHSATLPELKETGLQYIARQLRGILYFKLLRARRKPANVIAAIPTEFVGERICLWGTLEPREISLLKQVVAARDMRATAFLDIGANIGCYTLAFADQFAAVYAVEPNGTPLDLLRLNIGLNRLSNVTVFDVGLSDTDGEASFQEDTRNLGASHFVPDGTGGKTLRLRRGDALIPAGIPLGFIKCDVEGMELAVFRGLGARIARDKPLIFFESLAPADGQACVDYLRSLGYRDFHIVGENAVKAPPALRWLTRAIRGVSFRLWPMEKVATYHVNILASA